MSGRQVHLVGSVHLGNAEEVFRTASEILGDRLRRIPDGETGDRTHWIGWQRRRFVENAAFEVVEPLPGDWIHTPRVRTRPGEEPAFGRLGYEEAARESYEVFSRLRDWGVIAPGTKFLVCLPTPLAPVSTFVVYDEQAAVEPAYEQALLHELDAILAALPHESLAIQWDVCIETWLWERWIPAPFDDVERGVVERLVRYGERVPADVELGFHFCYGDYRHRHMEEPVDLSNHVRMANELIELLARPIAWLHVPVPRDRDDEEYLRPLERLRIAPGTELYLGLVHYSDGVEGTRRRIQTAERVARSFGIATECGFGRRDPKTVPSLLRIHAEAAT